MGIATEKARFDAKTATAPAASRAIPVVVVGEGMVEKPVTNAMVLEPLHVTSAAGFMERCHVLSVGG